MPVFSGKFCPALMNNGPLTEGAWGYLLYISTRVWVLRTPNAGQNCLVYTSVVNKTLGISIWTPLVDHSYSAFLGNKTFNQHFGAT